jgi:hypothetical protein
MKNLKGFVFLLAAALCLLAACSSDSGGEELPSVNLIPPKPSALPALAADVTVVGEKEQALALFETAVGPLMEAMELIGEDEGGEGDGGEWSVRGNSASRGLFSYSSDPIVYHNDKTVIPGASVTGYITGSYKSYSKYDEADDPSPGDYMEIVENAQLEVTLLEGKITDGIDVKGRLASKVYVKMRMETKSGNDALGYDTAMSSDINEQLMYALTITDTVEKTGGKFIFNLTAKGHVDMDFGDYDDPDLSGITVTATLKVYDNDNQEVCSIELDNDDIFNYLPLDK